MMNASHATPLRLHIAVFHHHCGIIMHKIAMQLCDVHCMNTDAPGIPG
jgi:hypothetical protein